MKNTDVLDVALHTFMNCYKDLGASADINSCIRNVCNKEGVRVLQHILNYDGVALRRGRRLRTRQHISSDPNHTWHIDGYDRLKPCTEHVLVDISMGIPGS